MPWIKVLCLFETLHILGKTRVRMHTHKASLMCAIYIVFYINTFKLDFHNLIYLLQFDITALFLYAGTLGNDGGYTKTGYPLKNVKGV